MDTEQTFWEHLDVLRGVLLRTLVVVMVSALVAFCFKDALFSVVLAPHTNDFVTFRLIGTEPFVINLVNTGLTEQLFVHVKVALYVGLLISSPYVLTELFRFVSPALYTNERRYAVWLVVSAYVMFMIGTVVNYVIVFPFTVQFLGNYQVSEDVSNMLTLQSYIDTLISMSLMLGTVFELPVICRLLSVMDILHRDMMTAYRRHAIVVILVIAAIITPTTDVFTLLLVSMPIWLLYEMSIPLVRR